MKLEDLGYDRASWKGTIQEIHLDLLSVFGQALGGNDGNINLIKCFRKGEGLDFLALQGTILAPTQWLAFEGEIIPGLLYNNLVEVKIGCTIDAKNQLVDEGLFFDLSPMAVALHFHTLGMATIAEVRAAAVDEIRIRHEKYVLDRHEGICFRAAAEFDPRLPEDEVGVPIPLAKKLLPLLAKEMGERAPKTVEEISGLLSIGVRFPTNSGTSITGLRIRIIDSEVLTLRYHDRRLKILFQGDCDGDQIMQGFPQFYLQSDQALKDMGSLPILPALSAPEHFGKLDLSLVKAQARTWPTGVQSAAGMKAKDLQGILTHGFDRIGVIAVIKAWEATEIASRVERAIESALKESVLVSNMTLRTKTRNLLTKAGFDTVNLKNIEERAKLKTLKGLGPITWIEILTQYYLKKGG